MYDHLAYELHPGVWNDIAPSIIDSHTIHVADTGVVQIYGDTAKGSMRLRTQISRSINNLPSTDR